VTETGTKYHKAGCRYLANSSIPTSLSDASTRYGPCSVCNPPVSSSGNTSKPASSSATVPSSSQCAATTQKGTRCSRKPAQGSFYCWQHGGPQ
jgi:hypothetical protein